ncbi:hypothetical protein CGK40_24065 [Vibrio parahaemolyticus]|uniref:hypothetical protein n=1 Tax=Vibrio parahaemolyticus TaxID=670 RepID=UPI0011230C5B|nr:hypothetical protein [Vibrio parahaemolyticus]TNZ86909.1 hypothetical protein CGK40_24065 [Vibrio parahaemolyticus]
MTTTADSLINTSVADTRVTLDCMLLSNPERVKELAEQALSQLPEPRAGIQNCHMTRIAMLRTMVRRANKLLAKSK